jgi:pyruvate ferredoxin oxidoreductase delta subunit
MKVDRLVGKSSLENKTGEWRTFKPIVTDGCRGCGICVSHCPEGVIEISKGKAKIDYDYCKGCLICENVCPFKAIKKVKEK